MVRIDILLNCGIALENMAGMGNVFYVVFISTLFLKAHSQTYCSDYTLTQQCASCKTVAICQSNTSSVCPTGQVCQQKGTLTLCTDPSSVPDCACTTTSGTSNQCDFYNSDVSIACFNGVIQASQDCASTDDTLTCDPDTGLCGVVATETTQSPPTTVPLTSCGSSSTIPAKNNCTSFFFCTAGQVPTPLSCDGGEIYSDRIGKCVQYNSFDCATDEPGQTGLYADPFNCSVYHSCFEDGTDGLNTCPPDQSFDPDLVGCSDTSDCTNEVCTPCRSTGESYPVDYEHCSTNYYQCIEESDSSVADDGYTISQRSCPGTLLYDPDRFLCTDASTCTPAIKKRKANH